MADAVVQARLRAGSLMHLGGTHLSLMVQGKGAVRHRRSGASFFFKKIL